MHLKCLLKKLNKSLCTKICVIASVAMIIGVCAFSVVKSVKYIVYADGQVICSVSSKKVVSEALELLSKKHSDLGIKDVADLDIKVEKEFSFADKASAKNLCQKLYNVCEKSYVRAYTISLKGVEAGTLPTYAEAEKVVESYKDHITNEYMSSEAGFDYATLTSEFVIESVICHSSKVSSYDYVTRHMLNGGSYSENDENASSDRVTAGGSLNLLYADKNFAFGMLKNESEAEIPDLDFIFSAGNLNSSVDIKTYVIEKFTEVVPFEIIKIETDTLYVDQTKVENEGANGIAENVYEVAYIDGKQVEKVLVSSTVVSEPVTRIEYVGTKEYPEAKPTGIFMWPIQKKFVITSYFGTVRPQISSNAHTGLDMAGVPEGTSIYAADGGTVIFASYSGNYGNLVKIQHENGVVTFYSHLQSIKVKVGEKVYKGQVIGGVGETGRTTGVHLHFEVVINGKRVDPLNYLPKK